MTPATLVVYGRYWYDFLTVSSVIAFFLIEMVLLFRNSLLGWGMTAKCLVLAGERTYVITHPPPLLSEDVTFESVTIRVGLIAVLGVVIVILIAMRLRRETVVVGHVGTDEPCKKGETCA